MGIFLATVPNRRHAGFPGQDALTLGRGLEVMLCSCWLLAPSQNVLLLAPSW